MSDGDQATTETKSGSETLGFQAEVKQLLQLMIHSLYSNKEIFLRELISNSSDACDKLRFESLQDASLLGNEPELKIQVDVDSEARTITISDSGIGMSREEVIENLGTIAKSGTKAFFESLTGDQSKDAQLIGQFGVGFYSSFIVAERVSVLTRRAGSEQAVRWQSTGEGEYTIDDAIKPTRGTDVILYLREDEDDFLQEWSVRSTIAKYSDHISLPVMMRKQQPPAEGDDGETVAEVIEYEAINSGSALWQRSKSEVTDEEYKEFYKHVSHDFSDPMAWVHNRVEGKLEYTSLLYVPERAPFDLYDHQQKNGVKLYVQRVFIMDEADKLLPHYLRFVKGVVDSNDLPLNVSRELLQSNKVIDSIRSGSVKKILSMLESMAKKDAEKYQTFWTEFGQAMKEGPAEDFANKERVAGLLRFSSTHTDTVEQTVSLADYIARMPEGQEDIYYIIADSHAAAKNSPHLEVFRKKGIEVLLLSDRIDEFLMGNMHEFDSKKFQAVTKGELDLSKVGDAEEEPSEEEKSKQADEYKALLDKVKALLADELKDVRLTDRLTSSPACLVVDSDAMSRNLERLLKQAGQEMPGMGGGKPILELNPEHALVQRLQGSQEDARFDDWMRVIYEQAVLAEGGQLEDPAAFVNRLNQLLLEIPA